MVCPDQFRQSLFSFRDSINLLQGTIQSFLVEVPHTSHSEPSPPNGISIHVQRVTAGASMAETPTQVSVAVADQENAAPTEAPLQVDV